jgi:hypothetical protein
VSRKDGFLPESGGIWAASLDGLPPQPVYEAQPLRSPRTATYDLPVSNGFGPTSGGLRGVISR